MFVVHFLRCHFVYQCAAVHDGSVVDVVLWDLLSHAPNAKVSYLNGDLAPRQAKDAGYAGIDYEDVVLKDNPSWIKEARKLGLITNVWTVDDTADIKYFFKQGVDFVTTNEPVKAKAL